MLPKANYNLSLTPLETGFLFCEKIHADFIFSFCLKVCDICGDVGREDLLAICSRCRDGAEHT